MTLPPDILAKFKAWGQKGPAARTASTTPEQRSKIARKAAKAKWRKAKAK